MPNGLPEITVAGTLTADPELRFTTTGTPVANFTIAANARRYDRHTGTWTDGDTTFLRCSVWRELAEHVTDSLHRGTRVIVTGVLRQRDWEDRDGQRRTSIEVDVTEVGPSLRWATATVHKTSRNSNGDPTGAGNPAGETNTAAASPPGRSAPPREPAGAAALPDEPPF